MCIECDLPIVAISLSFICDRFIYYNGSFQRKRPFSRVIVNLPHNLT